MLPALVAVLAAVALAELNGRELQPPGGSNDAQRGSSRKRASLRSVPFSKTLPFPEGIIVPIWPDLGWCRFQVVLFNPEGLIRAQRWTIPSTSVQKYLAKKHNILPFFVGFVFLFWGGLEFFHWRRASSFFCAGVGNDMELAAFAAAFAASDFVTKPVNPLNHLNHNYLR